VGSAAAINLTVSDGNDSDNGGNDSVEVNVYVPAVADAGGPHTLGLLIDHGVGAGRTCDIQRIGPTSGRFCDLDLGDEATEGSGQIRPHELDVPRLRSHAVEISEGGVQEPTDPVGSKDLAHTL
jgi:hypothetical protein